MRKGAIWAGDKISLPRSRSENLKMDIDLHTSRAVEISIQIVFDCKLTMVNGLFYKVGHHHQRNPLG